MSFRALQLLQELHTKQKEERQMQEDLEALRDALQSERENLIEVTSDRDRIKSLFDEKEVALEVQLLVPILLLYITCFCTCQFPCSSLICTT